MRQRKLALTIGLLLVVGLTSGAGASNMVINSTFDSDLSDWNGGGGGSMSWNASVSPTGGCMDIQGYFEPYPTMNTTATGGETLYVSYSAYSPNATGNLVVRMYVFGTGFVGGSEQITPTELSTWQDYTTLQFTLPEAVQGSQFTVTFDSYANAGADEHVYIDNVRVANTPVPEPTTMGLLMTGAVGVLLRKRRK